MQNYFYATFLLFTLLGNVVCQIRPKHGKHDGNTVKLDVSGLTKPLHNMHKLHVQLEVNGETITFHKHKYGRKHYFYAWNEEDGQSINLIERKRKDGSKLYVGSVVTDKKIYLITADEEGNAIARGKLSTTFPEVEDMVLPEQALEEAQAENAEILAQRKLGAEDGSIIDLMILWTEASECKISGLSSDCSLSETTRETAYAYAELCIEETNTAFDLSGVFTQYRLVHAYREENYVEADSNAFNLALSQIQASNDGVMDDVHGKREAYRADIVAMLIDDGQYCGLGYLGPSKNYMFSVTYWSCAAGYYTFGHETGHNLGLKHDEGTENACGTTNYNYGWRDPQCSFRTIMAYGCQANQCDDNPGDYCGKTQRFSTPLYTSDSGKAIGSPTSDNARKVNDVRVVVSNYFDSNESASPTIVGPAPTPSPTAIECVSDDDCTGDVCFDHLCEANECVSKPACSRCDFKDLEVEILTDNYPAETTWVISKNDEIVLGGGPYSNKYSESSYSTCVEGGHSYTFSIFDSYGDGICCCFGSGYYKVSVEGEEVVSGGNFGSSETKTFFVNGITPLPTPAPTPSPTISPTASPANTPAPVNNCKGALQPCSKDMQCCSGMCFKGRICKP